MFVLNSTNVQICGYWLIGEFEFEEQGYEFITLDSSTLTLQSCLGIYYECWVWCRGMWDQLVFMRSGLKFVSDWVS